MYVYFCIKDSYCEWGHYIDTGKFKNGRGCVMMLGRSGVAAMNLCGPLTSLNTSPIFYHSSLCVPSFHAGDRKCVLCLPGKHQHR